MNFIIRTYRNAHSVSYTDESSIDETLNECI